MEIPETKGTLKELNRLYITNDLWANRNKQPERKKEQKQTMALLLRIMRWAEKAKSAKTGQDYIMTDEFKDDLHKAVVFNNWDNSKIGLSKVEKQEANALWKKYSIVGRLCDEQNYPRKLDSWNVTRNES